MDSNFAAIGIIFWLYTLISCPITAQAKGFNSFFAFIAALFFGPLAMLHYAGLPDRKAGYTGPPQPPVRRFE